jgi:hypothetical protein
LHFYFFSHSFYYSVLSPLFLSQKPLSPFLKNGSLSLINQNTAKKKKKSISRTRSKHIFEERNYDFTLICYIHQHATNLPHKNQLSSRVTTMKNKQKSNARIPRKCESDQRWCQVGSTPGGVLPPSFSQGVGFSSHEAGEGEEQR